MSDFPLCPLCSSQARQVVDSRKGIFRCGSCGVEFISPQPSDKELEHIYSENYYKAWGISGDVENEIVKKMKIRTFNLRLDLISKFSKGKKILDVGCATGYFLEAAKARGYEAYGVELSEYSADLAKKKFGGDRIFCGTLEDAPFPKGSFDAIAMSDLIEHVRDPIAVLKKSHELLADGGIVMIMTPDHGSLTNAAMGKRWVHYKHEHLFYFDRKSIAYAARQTGFSLAHFERARKAMNVAYYHTQFNVYPHWLLTPIVNAGYALMPRRIRGGNVLVTMGEMAAILKKNP